MALTDQAGTVYAAVPLEPADVTARWPSLAGRTVSLAVAAPSLDVVARASFGVVPSGEYVAYDVGPCVLLVGRSHLSAVLAELAPAQLTSRRVKLLAAHFDIAALADPRRLVRYFEGNELVGARHRRAIPPHIGTLEALDAPDGGTGIEVASLSAEASLTGDVEALLAAHGILCFSPGSQLTDNGDRS